MTVVTRGKVSATQGVSRMVRLELLKGRANPWGKPSLLLERLQRKDKEGPKVTLEEMPEG